MTRRKPRDPEAPYQERMTPGVDHIYVGPCLACELARKATEHSICWQCGHVIDHAIGHPCLYGD